MGETIKSLRTTKLREGAEELRSYIPEIDQTGDIIAKIKIPYDKYNNNMEILKEDKRNIIINISQISKLLDNYAGMCEKRADSFEEAEQKIEESVASLGANVQAIYSSFAGTTTNTNQAQTGSGTTINPDNEEISPRPPLDVEIEDQEQGENLGDIPSTQVEAVIALIFGENITIPDSVKKIVTNAIAEINKTEILEGLDEEYSNKIRSEIIQDYLDGKLELEGITTEKIQEYIKSEPSIKILLETATALKSFDKLIADGVITEEQIKTSIEENLVIQSDEEFVKMYVENGGLESEAENVNSFYNPETGKMYVRNTVDSKVITSSIVTIMGDIMIYDEETGEVIYNNTQGNLDKDPEANISGPNTDTSTTPTDDLDKNPETNLSGGETDSSISNNEGIGDNDVTVEVPEGDKNSTGTTPNVEDIPFNEDINIDTENKK